MMAAIVLSLLMAACAPYQKAPGPESTEYVHDIGRHKVSLCSQTQPRVAFPKQQKHSGPTKEIRLGW